MWRGSLGVAYLFPPLSSGGASIAPPCPVSTSRSSNRTRISRIRLSDGRRLQAHATRSARTASPETQACSGVASSTFGGGYRLAPLSRPLSPASTSEVRPLSSAGVTRHPRYYEPVRHSARTRGSGWCRWGFPCCGGSPCIYMPSPVPRICWLFPTTAAFPGYQAGRLPH